jgi:chromosome partitioning protein
MRRIAFINEKGGTCKTTLCVNLGAWLASRRERRVLIVDLDTQGHAAKSLGIDVRLLKRTVHDLLVGPAVSVREVTCATAIPGLEVIPGNKELARFPEAAAGRSDRATRLQARLAGLQDYDFVLFDAPPSRSLVTENILLAADEMVVPVALTYLALDGCAEMMASLERLRMEHGRAPRISLVVPALYRKTQLADAILEKLRERFPRILAQNQLRYSVKIDEAQSHGQTIWEYAPRCAGALSLEALGQELLERAPAGAPAQAKTVAPAPSAELAVAAAAAVPRR